GCVIGASLFGRNRLLTLKLFCQFNVKNLPVLVQDVLNFMPKDKPEIVDPIETDRHGDDWHFINPKRRPINLRIWQKLYDQKPNACVAEYFGHLPDLFRSNKQFLQLRKSRTKLCLRISAVGRCSLREIVCAIKPSQLQWAATLVIRSLGCMRELRLLVEIF